MTISFNDDDYYVYWAHTLQLAYQCSGKRNRPVPLHGQSVAKGLSAKYLGLWK